MEQKNHLIRHIGRAIVECPQCQHRKLVPIAHLLGKMKTADIKCDCSHVFPLKLDNRMYTRRKTKLEGNFRKGGQQSDSFFSKMAIANGYALKHTDTGLLKNCTITDLSLGGIAIDIWGPHNLRVGEKLFIEFHLDNKMYSLIQVEVTVKSVRKNCVGAEFSEALYYKPEYGFYLWDEDHVTLCLENPITGE